MFKHKSKGTQMSVPKLLPNGLYKVSDGPYFPLYNGRTKHTIVRIQMRPIDSMNTLGVWVGTIIAHRTYDAMQTGVNYTLNTDTDASDNYMHISDIDKAGFEPLPDREHAALLLQIKNDEKESLDNIKQLSTLKELLSRDE